MEFVPCDLHEKKCWVCDNPAAVNGLRTYAGCTRQHSSIANKYGKYHARTALQTPIGMRK